VLGRALEWRVGIAIGMVVEPNGSEAVTLVTGGDISLSRCDGKVKGRRYIIRRDGSVTEPTHSPVPAYGWDNWGLAAGNRPKK